MPIRGERRAVLRKAGQKRSTNKRGRRPAIRVTQPPTQDYEVLRSRGFVVAKPELQKPKADVSIGDQLYQITDSTLKGGTEVYSSGVWGYNEDGERVQLSPPRS